MTNKNGIRFLAPDGRVRFTVPDEGSVLLCRADGTRSEMPCRYLDDDHLMFGTKVYEVRELAGILDEEGSHCEPFTEKRVIWSDIDFDLRDWEDDLNSASWQAFLRTAAYQYKYPFADQVLIYAQRPGATACAELEFWNEHFGRWVNRGAHGIALIIDREGHPYLRHVFDIRDTHHREEREFRLWELKPEADREVITALENRFGELDEKYSVAAAVLSATKNICEDNLTDYLNNLMTVAEGSALGRFGDDDLRDKFHRILSDSVGFSVMTRLGFEAHEYFDADAFREVTAYNTPATVNCLGCATGDLSELCLREIEKAVRVFEKNQNRTFDGRAESGYNEGENKTAKGGNENGIHDAERREPAEPDLAGDAAETARKVRDDAARVSDEAPQGNLHDASDRSDADRASFRGEADGENADFGEYQKTGDEPWRDGEAESGEPDAVGADDEQHQSVGGGGSSEQPDLRVKNQPPRLMPDDLIQILRHGDYLTHSKAEIVSFLSQETDEAKKTAFIRECYPKLTASMFKTGTSDYLGYSGLFDDGLHVFAGTFMNPSAAETLDWDFTRKLIEALVKDRNYLDEPKAGEQMSFTDMEANATPVTVPESKNQFLVSEKVVNELLRLGGCTRKSTERIYSFFRRATYPFETVAFIKREYESDAVGLMIDGRKAAATWDENGIRIAEGESVNGADNSILLSWEEVAVRIRRLMEAGQYLPQTQAEKADEIWVDYVANQIAYLYRDRFSEIPEEYKTVSRFNWPDITQFYAEILSDQKRTEALTKEISDNIGRLTDVGPRSKAQMAFTLMLARTFTREQLEYPAADKNVLPPLTYLSEDKIDDFLLNYGNGSSQGKYRIYSFFLQNSDTAARAKFLSNDFGIGGSCGGRLDDTHDGKGLSLSIGMLKDPEHRVLLSWPQVAKRLDGYIKSDRYMSEDELAHLDDYEKEQIGRAIVGFYHNKSLETPRPFAVSANDFFDEHPELLTQLDDHNRVTEIAAMMQTVLDNEMPGSYQYKHDKNALDSVKSYLAGTYNLFPGAKGRENRPATEINPPDVIDEMNTDEDEPETDEPELPEDTGETDNTEPEQPEAQPEYDIHLGTEVMIGKDECSVTSLADGKGYADADRTGRTEAAEEHFPLSSGASRKRKV